jgi:putative phage-type endonuclease
MANAVGTNAVGTNAVGTNAVGTNAVGTNALEIEETDYNDLFESICILTEAYIHLNLKQFIQPSFHSGAVKDIVSILNHTLAQTAFDTTSLEKEVERGLSLFYKHIAPPRSNGPTFIRIKPNVNKLRQKINYLQSVPQPEQRTKEWYEFRYKHLTASNIWKIFISDSTRNQLIFEKCQPLNADKFSNVSLESPMHWGQKYEPVSVMLYEHMYAAKVSDFGCIPHRTLEFLAASPDGIVTQETSTRYGRMLEVKNIVNREINGNPKMEYWVQMQLQMEVCDLNECDFLETRFQEYPSKEAFVEDNHEYKGVMLLFMSGSGKPVYEYAPLLLDTYDEWQEEMMEKNNNLTWIKTIYWKLDQVSCVLVLRNKLWFASVIPQLRDIWAIIEREKKEGYGHRLPKKAGIKVKKLYSNGEEDIPMKSQCFIDVSNL